jgi:hypothetical protein
MKFDFLNYLFSLKKDNSAMSNTLKGKYNDATSIAKYEAPDVITVSDRVFSGMVYY